MNERIRELAKQAGCEFWQRLENDVVNPEAYITFDPPQTLEKFAELIVKECANLCHERKLTPSTFTGDELLEKFGVKNE